MSNPYMLLDSLKKRAILIKEILNMNRHLRDLYSAAKNNPHIWKDIGRTEVLIEQLYKQLDILTYEQTPHSEKPQGSATV